MSYFYRTKAILKRMNRYVNGKAALSDHGVRVLGWLHPIDSDEHTIALNMHGQAYAFDCDGTVDIQPNDQLVVDDHIYGVRGVKRTTLGSRDTLSCVCEKAIR